MAVRLDSIIFSFEDKSAPSSWALHISVVSSKRGEIRCTSVDEAGFAPDIVHQVMGPTMVENLVAAGVGVSLISATSAHARADKVVTIELDSPHAELSQAVVWHEQNRSPVLESFLARLRGFNNAS